MASPDHQTALDHPSSAAVVSRRPGDAPLPALRPPVVSPVFRLARRPWIWAVGLALLGGAGLTLFFQPWVTSPVTVIAETATLASATRVLAVTGRTAALHSVDLRALVGGTLVELLVAEGDTVEKGAEVAWIDAGFQQAMLRQAVAGLDAALVAEAQAKDTLARTENLGANVARTAFETAARAVQSAAQEVARATALVDQAQVQLENYTIRAPMTGSVLALNVESGQSIDPTTVLMTIADLGELVVETDVDEAYATQIRAGLPAVLQLAGQTGLRDGHVTRVSQRVDAATGGLAVDLSFDAPVRAPIGLTVTINIIVDSLDAAITAPREAIQTGDQVFVVVDGIAARRTISVIDWPAPRLIVTDGLEPGDVLIVDAADISDGQTVRVAQP